MGCYNINMCYLSLFKIKFFSRNSRNAYSQRLCKTKLFIHIDVSVPQNNYCFCNTHKISVFFNNNNLINETNLKYHSFILI